MTHRPSDLAKRTFDVTASLFALVLLLPLFLGTALLVRLFIGTPLFFRQTRPGLGGRPFEILKFRTMTQERRADGTLLPDEDRLTRFGKLLRSSSLDELPELLNILRGEMSFVGPRPLLMQYLPLYSPEQARRHAVRPGLTGWAQIKGRNAISWEEKFALDVWYVDHRDLVLDLKILVLTAWTVIRREGINAEGDATMPAFQGSLRE